MGKKESKVKYLVTGGGGFLGCYIVEQLLDRGEKVAVFARGDYPELRDVGVELIRGSLADLTAVNEACRDIDTVFHVAALAGMWGKWKDFYLTNVLGTENVITACKQQGVKKLIYTSSPSVVFDNKPQEGVDETIPYPARYESHYAKSKAMGEQLVIAANGEKLLTCSLRPHLIFGPRDPHLLVTIAARARDGKLPQIGDGKNKVDFSYVEDAARAHLLAADALEPGSPVSGSVYFISQDEPVELWPWFNDLFSKLDLPPVKRHYSLRAARTLGAVLEFVHRLFPFLGEPRITRFLASELALSHYYNISKAKQDFGYQPQLTMAEGVDRTIGYLRNQLNI
ncbi:MAG: NAD-dependent epimerase/dehydratase family protein [Candidatus Hodarchaeales archaeon]